MGSATGELGLAGQFGEDADPDTARLRPDPQAPRMPSIVLCFLAAQVRSW